MIAERLFAKHPSASPQVLVVTDGQPTAYYAGRELHVEWPMGFGGVSPHAVAETMKQVRRITRQGVTINTFMLDDSPELVGFVERMTQVNRGRAFFTSPEALGSFLMVDYLRGSRKTPALMRPLETARRVGEGAARWLRRTAARRALPRSGPYWVSLELPSPRARRARALPGRARADAARRARDARRDRRRPARARGAARAARRAGRPRGGAVAAARARRRARARQGDRRVRGEPRSRLALRRVGGRPRCGFRRPAASTRSDCAPTPTTCAICSRGSTCGPSWCGSARTRARARCSRTSGCRTSSASSSRRSSPMGSTRSSRGLRRAAAGRREQVRAWIDRGRYTAADAREAGLVDGSCLPRRARGSGRRAGLAALARARAARARAGARALGAARQRAQRLRAPPPRIAVLFASGSISRGEHARGIASRAAEQTLDALARDRARARRGAADRQPGRRRARIRSPVARGARAAPREARGGVARRGRRVGRLLPGVRRRLRDRGALVDHGIDRGDRRQARSLRPVPPDRRRARRGGARRARGHAQRRARLHRRGARARARRDALAVRDVRRARRGGARPRRGGGRARGRGPRVHGRARARARTGRRDRRSARGARRGAPARGPAPRRAACCVDLHPRVSALRALSRWLR